jgi:serine/threonine protein kinase
MQEEDDSHSYLITKRLTSGSFGTVYRGVCKATGDDVAIKVEKQANYQLQHEANIIQKLQGISGFPRFFELGEFNSKSMLVMELLGRSLESLLKMRKTFSIKTVVMVSVQMFRLLQALHDRHYLHRDLKPANMMLGINEKRDVLHLIDFGLSRLFRDKISSQMNTGYSFVGTLRFASRGAHVGHE